MSNEIVDSSYEKRQQIDAKFDTNGYRQDHVTCQFSTGHVKGRDFIHIGEVITVIIFFISMFLADLCAYILYSLHNEFRSQLMRRNLTKSVNSGLRSTCLPRRGYNRKPPYFWDASNDFLFQHFPVLLVRHKLKLDSLDKNYHLGKTHNLQSNILSGESFDGSDFTKMWPNGQHQDLQIYWPMEKNVKSLDDKT